MSLPKIDTKAVSVSLVVSVVTVVIPAWLFLDNRFAHAGEVEKIKQLQVAQFQELKEAQQQTVKMLRQQMVSDRVFELQLKPNPTQVDQALLDRYKRELEQLK
jgi:hypothetical protein